MQTKLGCYKSFIVVVLYTKLFDLPVHYALTLNENLMHLECVDYDVSLLFCSFKMKRPK